ncbi:MAG: nuclease-related domain-containing DEAD/DEAH box helicase [Nostoc sp.]
MAIMIPERLSSTTKSNAEKKLFQIFAENLSDDYIVFHGAWWQHIKYVVQDREADFIIVHPKKGILIAEVKGGTISYDAVNMTWYTNDKQMKISPFAQAREIKYKFLDFLSKYDEFKKRDFCIGHCVIFPDVDEVINGLPSEATQEILLLRPQLDNISKCISYIFHYYEPSQTKKILGDERINLIIQLISPSTVFKKYIANDLGEIQQEIIQLTEQQFNILNNLYLQSQSIILGCAGSGKTQLAIEKARRLCQHYIKTIVTCKSNNLSIYLSNSLQNEIQAGNCVVYSFEEIQAKKTSLQFKYTAIIVDEGQDFERQEINELRYLIPDDGIFYIFQDSNQNVSKNANLFALQVNPNVLDKNCRNTHNIFKYAEPYVSCVHPIKSSLIQGRDVIHREYKNTNDIFKMLENDILNLVDNENVSPDQIIILTDIYLVAKSILSAYSYINRFNLKQYSFSHKYKNTIYWSDIGMYKGLENDIVIILFEKPKTLIPSNWDIANKYVGATRAKSFLIIYDSPDLDIDF